VPATTQALHNNRLSPFAHIHRTRNTSSQSASNSAAERISALKLTKRRTDTSAQDRRAQSFLIKLLLPAGQRLAIGQVRLIRRGWSAIEDRLVVCTAIGTGRQQRQSCGAERKLHFHCLTFLVSMSRKT
jgi:hypothetical protein